jgi:hypothetical protein
MKVHNNVKERLAKAVETYHAELQKEPNVQKAFVQLLSFIDWTNFILKSADRGFPLTFQSIESYANSILQRRIGSTLGRIGYIHFLTKTKVTFKPIGASLLTCREHKLSIPKL